MTQLNAIFATLSIVLAAFLLLALLLHRHYPRQRYLHWMMLAIASMILGFSSGFLLENGDIQLLSVVVLYTMSATLTCQTILVMTNAKRKFPATLPLAIVLAGGTVGTAVAGYPFVYNTIPFHFGCGAPLFEAGWRMFRQEPKRPVDLAIAASLMVMVVLFGVRGIGFAYLFDPVTSYSDIESSRFATLTILVMALPGLTLSLLMVYRMLDTVASNYRLASQTDSLTGLLNREAFASRVEEAGDGSYLILCDIDYFKRVNDNWGHAVGDAALVSLAELFREINVVAGRLGGEEFAILLAGANDKQARLAAEGIRTAFSLRTFPGMPEDERLTASFGVAAVEKDDGFDKSFKRADEALYAAKNEGRNRVSFSADVQSADTGINKSFQAGKPSRERMQRVLDQGRLRHAS
ncbi:MAG: GGDEF domain-containing protein [Rhizobiaceae bacterium]